MPKGFCKVRHAEMVVGVNGNVSFSEHNPGLLVARILLKDALAQLRQTTPTAAVASSRFRVSWSGDGL
jgi:hypothetical protein